MAPKNKAGDAEVELVHVKPVEEDDDAALRALGYVPSFKREFSNISTVMYPSRDLSLS